MFAESSALNRSKTVESQVFVVVQVGNSQEQTDVIVDEDDL